ncbi:MAG: dihydrolipoamide acetyltransferase family protein [Candidatus Aminicenantaceae bacterium]
MAQQFRFPDVGEGITEGEIVRWVVKEGDEVEEDQTLVELETDKAVVEIPSPYKGTILKIHFQEKDIIKVGEVLVTIGKKGETLKEDEAVSRDKASPIEEKPAHGIVGEIVESDTEIKDISATPKVRRMAKKMGVDIKTVVGSGPSGRIMEDDIQKATEQSTPLKSEKKAAFKIKSKYDFYGTLERLPLRGIRRATAKRMVKSVSKAAHVCHMDEADVTELVKIRGELKGKAEEQNIKLTYLPFIIKAVVASLKVHPLLNAMMDEDHEEIIIKKYYNIGVAVDIPDGLIVPVVKAVDQKTLFMLAEEIQNLAKTARERSLDMADLKGGTFSITNVGMIGGEFATPIINYPEVAILATMKIADRARVENGAVVVKKTLPLCLAFDHRVIDGAEVARFMNDLINLLENPSLLLFESGEE